MSTAALDRIPWTPDYVARLEAFAAVTPDYDETVESDAANTLCILPRVRTYLLASPNGPAMGYYFIKNPSTLVGIQKLPRHRVMQELWKLDTQLAREVQLFTQSQPWWF